jgi:hypothetical protein
MPKNKSKNLVVGLDLSTACTGIVVLDDSERVYKETYIKSSAKDKYKRIHIMADGVRKSLVRIKNRIDMVVIEDVFHITRKLFSLLELRGVIIETLRDLGLEHVIISTKHARYVTWVSKDVPDFEKLGRDGKKEVVKQFMERTTKHKYENHDTSDAGLMALAYIRETNNGG